MAAWTGTSNIWRGMSSLSFSTSCAAGAVRAVAVDDERQGVDRLAVDQHVELDQVALAVADLLVVHARRSPACGS